MPFTYTSPDQSRAASTIAELLSRQGQIAADRAAKVGDIWGRTIQQGAQAAGQAVASITDPQRLMAQAQLNEFKRQQAGRATLVQGIQLFPPDPQTGAINHQGIADYVSAKGFPEQAESYLSTTTKNAEALASLRKMDQEAGQARLAYLGNTAYHANTFEDFTSGLADAVNAKLLDPQTAMKYQQQAEAAGPDGWKAMQAQVQKYSPEWQAIDKARKEPKVVGDDQRITTAEDQGNTPPGITPANADLYSKQLEALIPAATTDPTLSSLRLATASRITNARTAKEAEEAIKEAQAETAKIAAAGNEVQPVKTVQNGQNVEIYPTKNEARAHGAYPSQPPASLVVAGQIAKPGPGEEVNPTVKAIAEYRQAPPPIGRPGTQALMDAVNRYNPSYDAKQFPLRSQTMKAYTTGTEGQQINALNTAILHMDLLADAADALKNGNFKPGNEVYNKVRDLFGSATPNNYDTIKEFLDGEVGAVVKKGIATEGEMGRLEKKAGSSGSPEQLAGYIRNSMKILGGKSAVLDDKYHSVMGKEDPFSVISPRSEEVLTKHGINPADFGGPPAFSVTAPNGKTYTFKTQADLDTFKKRAGL